MARNETFNALDNMFDDMLDEEGVEKVKADKLTVGESTPVEEGRLEESEPRQSKPNSGAIINFEKSEPAAVTRTFRVDSDISEVLDGIVTKSNGERRKGSKGFLSQLVNNAVIKELVELGAIDESYLNKITPYGN